jgi:hypothetical protein
MFRGVGIMKLAAYVMTIERDEFFLKRLIKHNLKSCDKMYVLDNGLSKEGRAMCRKNKKVVLVRVRRPRSVSKSPEYVSLSFTNWASDLTKRWLKKLLKDYDWVLYSSVDEFVVAEPRKYKNLKEFLKGAKEDYFCCKGYDVHHQQKEEPALSWALPFNPKGEILKLRKYWARSHAYNKPLLSRVPLDWVVGHHKLKDESDDNQHKRGHKDLYLIHLKHVDFDIGRPRFLKIDPNIDTYETNFEYREDPFKGPLELIPERFKIV